VTWLIAHQQELFIGILTSAAVAIAGYLLHRWFGAKQQPTGSALTAQGARVERSPVATGSGVTQTISETHHYHYAPEAAPVPQPSPAPEPEGERPRPNLTIVVGRKIFIHTGLDGSFYQSEEGHALGGEAIVANVTNDARRAAANIGAIVKATIIYQESGQELLRGMACWLSEGSGMVQFRVDDSHSVVLGVVINGRFSVPTKRRATFGIGHVTFPTDPNYLNFERASVTVRLTNADTGDLYCEEHFEVVSNPLSIARLQTA
jgi:hypothetical protein